MIKWRKSSYTGGGNDEACVEVAPVAGGIWVRDFKNPEGERLELRSERFAGLLARLKRGELSL